jgi:hypothetical protein
MVRKAHWQTVYRTKAARPWLFSLALLTALISAVQAQTGAPEILWQFEAGG